MRRGSDRGDHVVEVLERQFALGRSRAPVRTTDSA
jgi:hypothetical protein